MERDLARLDRAATASNAKQFRAAVLGEQALRAQANVSKVTADAAKKLDDVIQDSAISQDKYAAEVKKAKDAVTASKAAYDNASASSRTLKAAKKAEEDAEKALTNVGKVRAAGQLRVQAIDKATEEQAAKLTDQYRKQENTLKSAINAAQLKTDARVLKETSVPDTAKGQQQVKAALEAERKAYVALDEARINLNKTRIAQDQLAVGSAEAKAAAIQKAEDDVAKAEEVANNASIAAAAARAASDAEMLAAKSTASAGIIEAELREAAVVDEATGRMVLDQEKFAAVSQATATQIEQAEAQKAAAFQAAAEANVGAAKSATAMSTLAKTGLVATAIAGAATAAVVTKVGFSYNMTRESAEKAFAGILKDAPKANAFIEELYGWTRKTSLGFDTAVHSAQEFLARGFKLEDVIPTMETIANAAAKLPEPMEQSMQRISYAIGQIEQSAKLHSQDIRQLTEAGIDAWGMLAEATGASIDDMQKDAEKFGLTGPRVAQIILEGMKKGSSDMLRIQSETGRGQVAIASRNFQELSGVFTKPFYQKFVEGLKLINDVMSDPRVLDAAASLGQALFDAFNKPLKPLADLYAGVKDLNNELLKQLPGVKLAEKGVEAGGGLGNISKIFSKSLFNQIPIVGQTNNAVDAYNFINRQVNRGRPSNTSERIDDLLDKRNNLTKLLGTARDTGEADKLRARIASIDSDIEAFNKALNGSGEAAGHSAAKVLQATNSMDSSWDKAVSSAQTSVSAISARLADLLKSGPTQEQLQLQLSNMNADRAEQPRRLEISDGLKQLDRQAKEAADANKLAADAVDAEIDSIQRGIAARDRAEARQEIVDRFKLTGSEKAQRDLDDFDRALQRAELSTNKKSDSDRLQQQIDDAQAAQQRGDLQGAIEEAQNSGRHVSKRRQREKAVEDAQKALARFDQEQANKKRLQQVKDAEEAKKNADALKRMDKEDQIKKLKDAEDRQKQQKDLQKFDRETGEQAQIQKLQDQRDAIIKAGDAIQAGFDKKKQDLDDELTQMDRAKGLRDQQLSNLEEDIKKFGIIAQLVDVDKLPKQGELEKKFSDITDELTAAYNKLKDAKIGQEAEQNAANMGIPGNIVKPPGRAMGGPVGKDKLYTVGEKGPEIFSPDQDGTIIPANIVKMLSKVNFDFGYGARYNSADNKGLGFFGPLQRADGDVMTEDSIGVSINNKDIEVPALVPTLSKSEVEAILKASDGSMPPRGVIEKATEFAQKRLASGKNPFATIGEQHPELYPDIPRAWDMPNKDANAAVQLLVQQLSKSKPMGGARALGGPVDSSHSYLVGENGVEAFISNSLAQIASQYARRTWPGNAKAEAGEVHAAMDGLDGYFKHQKLSQDWIDAYLPYVQRLEQQVQKQNAVTPVGIGNGNGGNNTINNNNHRSMLNLAPITINMGNNQRPQDGLDYLYQKF